MFKYVLIASLFFFSNVVSSQTFDLDLALSSENVLDIKKQDNGLLWAATDEGLNVFYDDEKYVFYSDIQDSLSILNSKIDKLFISSNDILITLSQDGLSVFNNETFNFKQIKLESKPIFIVEDPTTSKFWVATENSGYYVLNSNFESDGHYKFDPLSPLSISTSNLVGSKKESIIFNDDKVFIATKNGFNSFNKKLKTFKRFFRGNKTLFTTNNVIGINEINEKILVSFIYSLSDVRRLFVQRYQNSTAVSIKASSFITFITNLINNISRDFDVINFCFGCNLSC